ncbi:hypothetical protein JOC34_000543 [Virgibacillus halotolerans]|nr:hypothetical protein [Virgibacillus halotolerans]MBM7598186.1 hypothetical protein [Virgibacillus halotolerans]
MNKSEIERIHLIKELAKHGLKAETWELNYELKRKLSAARTMDLKPMGGN